MRLLNHLKYTLLHWNNAVMVIWIIRKVYKQKCNNCLIALMYTHNMQVVPCGQTWQHVLWVSEQLPRNDELLARCGSVATATYLSLKPVLGSHQQFLPSVRTKVTKKVTTTTKVTKKSYKKSYKSLLRNNWILMLFISIRKQSSINQSIKSQSPVTNDNN